MEVKWPDPPLERSILGWDPLDEFVVTIAEWIVQQSHDRSNLEIEAKVGRIVEKHSNQRIMLPVQTETIVHMQPDWKFESRMTDEQHKKINELLNSAVEHNRKLSYKRIHEIDLFFTDHDGGGGKVRVTKDPKTFHTKAVIKKTRIADLNIHCPNHSLDYRISINVEEPRDEPPPDDSDFTREKNRLHYTHEKICVDLTQVDAQRDGERPTNELELEFLDAKELLDEAQANIHASIRQEWTPYYDSILVFINSTRMLIRNAD